jgi:hypothetical protein
LISAVASKGFQQVWAMLQPAVKHYLRGFDATEADMRSAAKDMLDFACTIEAMVIRQWVRTARVYGAFLECVCGVYGIFFCNTCTLARFPLVLLPKSALLLVPPENLAVLCGGESGNILVRPSIRWQ